MKAREFCPHEFDCFMEAKNIHQTLAFIDIDFHDFSLLDLVKINEELIQAYDKAVPSCQSVFKEGKTYMDSMIKIVNCKNDINLVPDFHKSAAERLHKFRVLVALYVRNIKNARDAG